jgi:hypothetical protein
MERKLKGETAEAAWRASVTVRIRNRRFVNCMRPFLVCTRVCTAGLPYRSQPLMVSLIFCTLHQANLVYYGWLHLATTSPTKLHTHPLTEALQSTPGGRYIACHPIAQKVAIFYRSLCLIFYFILISLPGHLSLLQQTPTKPCGLLFHVVLYSTPQVSLKIRPGTQYGLMT